MQSDSQEVNNYPFIKYTEDEIVHNFIAYWIVSLFLFGAITILPFTGGVWFFFASVVLLFALIQTMFAIATNYGRSSLLNDWEYLVLSYDDEEGKKHHRFLLSDKYLSEIYTEYGNSNAKHNVLHQLDKLKAQHLTDKKIIEGFQEENYAKNALWYILKDDQFYFDDKLGAILAFTTKEEAQEYVNHKLPDFKGQVVHLPLAVNGKIREGD